MLFPANPAACTPVLRFRARQEDDDGVHADVIGSLLRPHYLVQARAALAVGRMSMRNQAGRGSRGQQALAMQEGCGLDVVNDGELRRFSFLDHLLGDMEGVAAIPGAPVHFHAPDPAQDWDWHPPFTVTGRIRPKGPMMTIEEFSYARGQARVPVKITMPSPLVMYGAWSPEHLCARPTPIRSSCSPMPPRLSARRRANWLGSAAPTSRSTRPTSARSWTRRTARCAKIWACLPNVPSPKASTSSIPWPTCPE